MSKFTSKTLYVRTVLYHKKKSRWKFSRIKKKKEGTFPRERERTVNATVFDELWDSSWLAPQSSQETGKRRQESSTER
jgi:hypothetical protein